MSTVLLYFQITILLALSHFPATTARSSFNQPQNQQQQQLLQSSLISSTSETDEDGARYIDSNSIQWRQDNHNTSDSSWPPLKRVFLSNRTITCNDGSQAGFYLRKTLKSKRWVVFLEGGWHCYDNESCKTRWTKYRNLMTSAKWPENRGDSEFTLS